MLHFVVQKIKNKKWLNLCLLVGIALLVSVFACHPMLERGSGNQLLQTAFSDYAKENQEFPAIIIREDSYKVTDYDDIQAVYEDMDAHENAWLERMAVDKVVANQALLFSGNGAEVNLASTTRFLNVGNLKDMDEHIQVVKGTALEDAKQTDGSFPCLICEEVMDNYSMVVGEEITFPHVTKGNEPVKFVVAGIIKESSYEDNYWSKPLADYGQTLFVTEDTMNALMKDYGYKSISARQRLLLDYTQISGELAKQCQSELEQLMEEDATLTTNFLTILMEYDRQQQTARMILRVLELPCVVLLLLFIYMVSSQILTSEEGEIAVLRSRGVTKRQVLNLYILQSVLLSLAGIVLGIVIGYFMCKAAAGTNAFLQFSGKDVSMYQFTWWMIPYGAVGCLITILCMTLPVIPRTKITIVAQKTANHYKSKKPFWEKCFLDLILLGIAVYLLYNYNKQRDELALRMIAGESLDPMIFLDASLFIFSCGLVFLRLCRYLIMAVDFLGKKKWKPAIYASFLQIRRTFYKQSFLAIFLIMTIASGIFDSNMARTMNENSEERIRYQVGTDLWVTDDWQLLIKKVDDSTYVWNYYEPSYEPYEELVSEGMVDSMTKVIQDDSVVVSNGSKDLENTLMLGIHTKEFGETAQLMEGLNDRHWYNDLNSLAANPDGVIISRNVADELEVKEGDVIRYTRYSPIRSEAEKGKTIDTVRGTVSAIVDCFPGYERYHYSTDKDGNVVEEEQYLVVANYAAVVSHFGLTPYKVWMKRSSKATDEQILQTLDDKGAKITDTLLTEQLVEKNRSSALIQITNGMFTMSFIISLLICSVGFLIYWIMSIKNRELLFGIYRAMGMPMRDIRKMLMNEQLFGSVLPVFAGGAAGALGTVLFVKLIAVVYLPMKHNISIRIFVYASDMVKLFAVVLLVMTLCFTVIRRLLAKMRIADALKLGED